ncbi:type VI secretion system protein TssL, short form [Enterobacter hormaechei]|uniref:type VI secretion system protein TssL, short form n=1 Tax=Enterobacter hormaechei TaxID=158836 RepID=UPI00198240B3|nr:type VI secretion system protein TssL, short form [Enterobacter hormaechei]MBN4832538.1 DotU family type IV/VI secretion system protein [Enterobacter hormaechei]
MKQAIDTDALMANAWLTVTELRFGTRLADGEGETLWQHCVDDIEQVMAQLEEADVSEASRRHILYAWCALLDETAKGRGVEDDASIVWYDRPLQAKYFGSMDAGDELYERMRQVLREPAPDIAVLTCFHRVLMLGFKGSHDLNDPARNQLVRALEERVPPFATAQDQPVLATISGDNGLFHWLRHWPVCIGLSAIMVTGLWLALNHWLDVLVAALLPGAGK